MADQFGSVDLIVLPGGMQDDGPAIYSQRTIPGSTDIYIDVSGPSARHIVLPLYATGWGGFDALRALIGTTAELTYGTTGGTGVDIASALLVDVRVTQTFPLGETYADGEFLVVTP